MMNKLSSFISKIKKFRITKVNNFFFEKIFILVILVFILKLFLISIDKNIIDVSLITNFYARIISNYNNLIGFSSYNIENEVYLGFHKLVIVFLCTGIDQILFLGILLFTFFGFKNKQILIENVLILIIVFLLNLVRLFLFYPLVNIYGYHIVQKIHLLFYYYFQGLFLIAIFFIYVVFKSKNYSKIKS
jgi:hypothetical protein